ncbi:MAG: carboxypeptidase regulatory-like domain-containing protein, partial [Gemmatimonadales bacterium]
MKRWLAACSFVALAGLLLSPALLAQGVTTGALTARVFNPDGAPVAGARVTAVHVPSGTSYTGSTRADGRAPLAGMRVGGPYRVTAAAIGFEAQTREDVYVALGVTEAVEFSLRQAVVTLEEVTVTATGETVFSSQRTGAATTVPREALTTLPTVTGQLGDFTRLTPQVRGRSFAGQDDRLNNITVDGSYFNNGFGLGGAPGERTGVTPISIAALQEVQVNIAPYDVRQGHFIGANVNTVTRSGTNEFTGMLQYTFRQCTVDSTGACEKKFGLARMNGNKAGDNTVSIGDFDFERYGGYVGGPIIKNKLFFFASYEHDGLTSPATTFRANEGGETVGGSITRVLRSDLDQLSDFLTTNFNYDPGLYQLYNFDNPATRFIGKLDYNLNDRNKLSVRYNHLDSFTDVLVSNSSSLGVNGNRRTNTTALNFQSSNYQIVEDIRSVVAEWNSAIGSRFHNNLIVGYSHSDESRATAKSPFNVADASTWFPLVDILQDGQTYTSFGMEPFTPNNELRYGTWQLQNNFTVFGDKHDWTFGVSGERFRSFNVFFQGAQSVYNYNSLADWYTDANDYLANPDRTSSPVTLRRFQVAWVNLPDPSCDGTNCPVGTSLSKPVQPLTAWYLGAYAQDEWRVNRRLRLTLGLRIDVPFFDSTGFVNPVANAMTFRDENGEQVKLQTQKLPDPNLQFSPRFGFNWDVDGRRNTQIRGGTGIMSGPPLYVWISNQVGNNGLLTGFQQLDNTTARPFHPDPAHYKPATVSGASASSFALAFTEPDFRFPQVWRTNVAIDKRLPWNIVGTAEFIYNRDVNGIYYINANLHAPQSRYAGIDTRPRWFGSCPTSGGGTGNCTRINNAATSAIVLKNQSVGRAWNIGGSLERRWQSGFFAKVAYDYGEAKNTVDPGSIALGSWQNIAIVEDPNNPGLGNSFNWPGHRFFATAAYGRDWLKFGRTTVAAFFNAQTIGNNSYLFSGDANGDGNANNDLLYIPRNQDEMNFQAFTANAVRNAAGDTITRRRVITSEEQRAAWDAYIEQDSYLSKHRGEYARRNAVILPLVKRVDFQITQDLHTLVGGKRNALQLRLDFLNFGNLLNSDWGVSQRFVNNQPLLASTSNAGTVIGCAGSFTGLADACGRLQYRLRTFQDPDPDGSGKNRYV